MASRLFVEKSLFDAGVGIDPAVAQKRPIPTDIFQVREIHFAVQNFFAAGGTFRDDNPLRIAKKRSAPKFKAVSAFDRFFVPNTIDGSDINSVSNRVAALDRAPGIALRFSIGIFFAGMPADSCRIEDDAGAVQRG